MRFVDANVFIYVLVKSPKKAYEISKGILKRIETGEETATSLAVIQEVVDWLEYNNRKKEARSFLTASNSYLTVNYHWLKPVACTSLQFWLRCSGAVRLAG